MARSARQIGATGVKLTLGLSLALGLGLLFWPIGVSIQPVRAADPDSVAAPLRLAFLSDRNLTYVTASALTIDPSPNTHLQRNLTRVLLGLRLAVFTSAAQRAAWQAQHAAFLTSGPAPLAQVTQVCFGKSPDALAASDAATLVAIWRIGRVAATSQPERLLSARDRILHAMASLGELAPEDLSHALASPLDNCSD